MILRVLVLLLFFFIWTSGVSEAAYVTINTAATVAVTDKNHAAIHVNIGNRGDEGAYNVRAYVDIDGKRLAGKLKNTLGVNESYEEDFSTVISPRKPGRYPVMVTIEYTDNNMYPFTVLSANYLNYMEPQNSRVVGMIPEFTVADSGSLQVVLSNIDREDRKVVVQPMAPKEFFFTDTRREVLVKAGEKKPVSFSVRNLAAYPSSKYMVYAFIEYDDDAFHYTAIAAGRITVRKETFLNIYKIPLTAALIILVSALAFYNVRRYRRNAAKA